VHRCKVGEACRRCRIRREWQCSRCDSDYKRSRSGGSKLWVVGLLCQNWPTGTTQPGTKVGLMTDGQGPVARRGSQVVDQTQAIPPVRRNGQHLVSLNPRFNVSFLRIRQSSWMYPPKRLSWDSTGLVVPLGRTRPFERLLVRKRLQSGFVAGRIERSRAVLIFCLARLRRCVQKRSRS